MIDVLFILVFAALAQRTVAGAPPVDDSEAKPHAEATIHPPNQADGGAAPGAANASNDLNASNDGGTAASAPAFEVVRELGLAAATRALEDGDAVVVRVSAEGSVTSLESRSRSEAVVVPLLERVADPDIALAYLGDQSPNLRVCAIASRSFDVEGKLVIVITDKRQQDLRVALVAGLRRDVERCRELGAMAVLVEDEGASP